MTPKSSSYERKNTKKSSAESSTHRRIIAGARHHFFAYGFRQVTMDDLAKELGMSKKTLYTYFSSKASLMEAVLLAKFGEVKGDLERITSSSPSDFSDTFRRMLECLQRHMGEIQPPFVRDVQREAPELFRLVENRRRDMIHTYFGKLLDEGRTTGVIRSDIPTKIIIEILMAAVDGIINPRRLVELGLTAKEAFSTVTAVIFEGVITETGRSHL